VCVLTECLKTVVKYMIKQSFPIAFSEYLLSKCLLNILIFFNTRNQNRTQGLKIDHWITLTSDWLVDVSDWFFFLGQYTRNYLFFFIIWSIISLIMVLVNWLVYTGTFFCKILNLQSQWWFLLYIIIFPIIPLFRPSTWMIKIIFTDLNLILRVIPSHFGSIWLGHFACKKIMC
jgi:hypothetical protein